MEPEKERPGGGVIEFCARRGVGQDLSYGTGIIDNTTYYGI